MASGCVPLTALASALLLAPAAPPVPVAEPPDAAPPPAERGASGNAVTLVHFFATWCAPCRPEIDALARFYDDGFAELERRGLRLEVVSNDVRRRDLDAFLDARSLPFEVELDTLAARSTRLALRALPATVVLGPGGRELARFIGPQDWSSPSFAARIAVYLEASPEETRP